MFNRSNNDEGIVAGLVDGDGRKLAGLLAVLVLPSSPPRFPPPCPSDRAAATHLETTGAKEYS